LRDGCPAIYTLLSPYIGQRDSRQAASSPSFSPPLVICFIGCPEKHNEHSATQSHETEVSYTHSCDYLNSRDASQHQQSDECLFFHCLIVKGE
jgi:hypothetical protein